MHTSFDQPVYTVEVMFCDTDFAMAVREVRVQSGFYRSDYRKMSGSDEQLSQQESTAFTSIACIVIPRPLLIDRCYYEKKS
jgi:GDP-D-mannose dehydratase